MKLPLVLLPTMAILTACAPLQKNERVTARVPATPVLQTYDQKIILKDSRMPFSKVAYLAMKKMGLKIETISEFKKTAVSKDFNYGSNYGMNLRALMIGDTLFAAIGDVGVSAKDWNRTTGNMDPSLNKLNHQFYAVARAIVADSNAMASMESLTTNLNFIEVITKNMTEAGTSEWVKNNIKGKVVRWNLPMATCSRIRADYLSISTPPKSIMATFSTDPDMSMQGVMIMYETDRTEYLQIPAFTTIRDSGMVVSGSKGMMGLTLGVTDILKK